MITTYQGIQILKSGVNPDNHIKTILSFYDAERIEQLTTSEISEVTNILEEFKDAILNPLDVTKIDFSFSVEINQKEHEIYIGKITRLDINLTSLMQFEALNLETWDSIPYLVACVYAPIAKAALGLKLPPGVMIQKITDVFLNLDFKLIYGLYAFFLSYKITYTQNYPLSIQQFGSLYPRLLASKTKQPATMRSLKGLSKRKRLKKSSSEKTGCASYLRMLKAMTCLFIALGMMRFMKFITKRQASTSKDV